MAGLLLYCRSGFESDVANEVQDKASAIEVYGYPQTKLHSGFVLFNCYQPEQAELLAKKLSFEHLIFARQMFACQGIIENMDVADRVTPILAAFENFPLCGELRVEYADTTDGRELSKFCRKISVPLRQTLRKRNKLTNKENASKPVAHIFFTTSDKAYVGYSFSNNNSALPLGILRLKFPHAAPSRSTLKLDEAFQTFIPKEEHGIRLQGGLQAVDLGACPGGWTYQLVQRGMFVQAVDNGAMDQALMETGQVTYCPEDGFKFQPKKNNVYWLVCDMIEQPQRVAKLMATWVAEERCKEAMFNLKLPMKKRYESMQGALLIIQQVMHSAQVKKYQLQAKHLYHNREEVTVHLRLM
ncbi:23S rRNA (cytidine(2498)-2'-O)-methyltransferase RlmM [Paraglaciecola aquimarina]|uniref:Ribosomal RNA large subunit methyltransferase M n=1 Tax=Paraglaciecola aquimarina TaxID=1235557 RepID=A0ABU3SXZ7_9ALTE|nr:23S rRNA (cytidine(2498)-2'-O)-methyltransferase RlmM [Paraglaciecola aquimarina]MDU0354880.1 23S rRNA (cytidine(2498)-2'-O)-methyltransferase RlmM [Paraglaciecola aquimarina]